MTSNGRGRDPGCLRLNISETVRDAGLLSTDNTLPPTAHFIFASLDIPLPDDLEFNVSHSITWMHCLCFPQCSVQCHSVLVKFRLKVLDSSGSAEPTVCDREFQTE